VVAFFLIGLASEQATSSAAGQGSQSSLFLFLIVGLIVLCVGVVMIAPTFLGLLARVTRRSPMVVRLAVRDLARYRARSGAALGAISLSVLIAAIICVIAAGRFGDVIDYAGPNLAANQLAVYPSQLRTDTGAQPTAAELATMAAKTRGIAASLGSRDVIRLEMTDSALQRASSGRNWNGPVYIATPQLLRAYGITSAQVNPSSDILSMRPGLSTLTKMQLLFGAAKFGPPGGNSPCPPSYCVVPKIQEVSALPSGTSAPNTVITEHAVRRLHLRTTAIGWLIQTPNSLTASQISTARQAAAAAGLSVENRNSIPTLSEIIDVATVFGILLALGILAMSVGLLRSETASDLRVLTATGASSTARRAISAVTAGALALTGAVVGIAGGYVAAIGFFRTNQLDTLSSLSSIPVTNLLLILVGMPLIAAIGGWLLAGREPTGIARRPME
jgi:putative ABC transport system permease protein